MSDWLSVGSYASQLPISQRRAHALFLRFGLDLCGAIDTFRVKAGQGLPAAHGRPVPAPASLPHPSVPVALG